MMKTSVESFDAVVIGANIRGLVTTYVLSQLGYRAVLVERGPRLGGADASFTLEDGSIFDHGMHVLDDMRSEVATRLFTKVAKGQVHRHLLSRGLVVRNQALPYAFTQEDLPDNMKSLLPAGELVDDIGDAEPTREALAACYGQAYTDLVFDEVLPSYPSEARHLSFGIDASKLLANIYPWFFPRARRPQSADESRAFHDKLREGIPQHILYPLEGGFGGFAQAFVDSYDGERIEVLKGAKDAQVVMEPGSHNVAYVEANGRRLTAPRYFWAGPWLRLCELLDMPWQQTATDKVVVGSFRFDQPITSEFDELLVGDPEHLVNRIHLPARFRGSDEPLLQIEFAFPIHGQERSPDPDAWKEPWLDSLRRLGLIGASHKALQYNFKSFGMHFNAFGVEGEPLVDADPSVIKQGNLHPVVPSLSNLNLNRHVPRTVRDVTAVLAEFDD